MTKKVLSFAMVLAMLLTLIAGMTLTVHADEAYQLASGSLAVGDKVIVALKSGDDYYALPNGNKSSTASIEGVSLTVNGGVATETSENTFEVYEDTDGNVGLKSTAGANYLGLNSNKLACNGWGNTKYLTFTDQGNGLYKIESANNAGRGLTTSGETFTCSNSSATPVYIFKLSETSASEHTHEYSWNQVMGTNGKHTEACANTDGLCTALTREVNCTYGDPVVVDPTCVNEGSKTFECTVCGYVKTESIPATGIHVDEDEDGICDTCGEDMPAVATFTLFTGDLVEGDYIIYYNGKAMNTTTKSNRLQYNEVTPVDDVISTDDNTIVWHIAQSGSYWTIYNVEDSVYAASTGTKNQATTAADSSDKTLWTVTAVSGGYEFVNKNNAANNVNANLRNNDTYGFACYATTTGGALSLYKAPSDAPVHTHDYSWDGNIGTDGTHTEVCANTDGLCTVPSREVNCTYGDPVIVDPTCVLDGSKTFTCTVCGYSYSEPIAATGVHVDADEDGVCDTCGEDMPEDVTFTLNTELHDGDMIVIYSPSGNGALTATLNANNYVNLDAVTINGNTLTIPANSTVAIYTVVDAGSNTFYFQAPDGTYFTAGSPVSFASTTSDAAKWELETFDSTTSKVYVHSVGYAYSGTNYNQYLEYYASKSGVTVYSKKTTEIYAFQIFSIVNQNAHVHDYTYSVVQTQNPTCTAFGTMTYTCECGDSYTENIPMIAHVDANGDCSCDACHGVIFNKVSTIEDGARIILVTSAFGKAMNGTIKNNYYTNASVVNAQNSIVVPVDAADVWTVEATDGGFYLINANGEYMYIAVSGTHYNLLVGDETNDNRVWTIGSTVEGLEATGLYLYNVGTEKYIECDNGNGYYKPYDAPTANYETWYAFDVYAANVIVDVCDQVTVGTVEVNGVIKNTATFIGTIVNLNENNADGFDRIELTLSFYQNGVKIKEKTVKVNAIYTTITGYASANESTATAQGITYISNVDYLYAVTIRGIESGSYTVNATVVLYDDSAATCTRTCEGIEFTV